MIIQFSEFKGKKLIDLRIFYNTSLDQDDWNITTKGIAISRNLILKLKDGVCIDRSFIKELWIFED